MEDLPLYDDDLVILQLDKREYLYLKNMVDKKIQENKASRERKCIKKGISIDTPPKRTMKPFKPKIIEIRHSHKFFTKENNTTNILKLHQILT